MHPAILIAGKALPVMINVASAAWLGWTVGGNQRRGRNNRIRANALEARVELLESKLGIEKKPEQPAQVEEPANVAPVQEVTVASPAVVASN